MYFSEIFERPNIMLDNKTLTYLKDLKKNNHKEWFDLNRDRYEEELDKVRTFAEDVLQNMRAFDEIETKSGRKSLQRIYRDVRFSKNKTPYKTHWGGGFKRATKLKRGGFYYHIEPGNSFIGGGFWGPSSKDLLHLRKQMASDPESIRKILNSNAFKNSFGELRGEQVKTAPKGFSKEDPAIDLLRFKQFLVKKDFTDAQVKTPGFSKEVAQGFREMLPFFNLMSDLLTHDLNGTPIPEEHLP